MLCFSPGKQLTLFPSRLCFSKEEKTIIKRKPRGSFAFPIKTRPQQVGWKLGLLWAGPLRSPGCAAGELESLGPQDPRERWDKTGAQP